MRFSLDPAKPEHLAVGERVSGVKTCRKLGPDESLEWIFLLHDRFVVQHLELGIEIETKGPHTRGFSLGLAPPGRKTTRLRDEVPRCSVCPCQSRQSAVDIANATPMSARPA